MEDIKTVEKQYADNILHNRFLFSIMHLVVPLLYYGISMSHTIGFTDAALVLNNAYNLNISAWVDNHNLFSLLSYLLIKIFSGIDPFMVSNTVSMVCGALTVFFVYLLSKEISNSFIISSIVSIVTMLSHSLTWHSTMLEVYTLNSFLMMVFLYCFYKYYSDRKIRFAYLGIFSWGLGISNHILMALFVFAVISFLIIERSKLSVKNIIIGFVCFLAGFSLFIAAFVKSAMRYHSIITIFHHFTGGDFRNLMFSSEGLLFWTKNYIYFFLYQFSIIAVIIGFFGIKAFMNRKPFSVFFLSSILVQLIWSLNYHVWDIFAFALPVYVMFAIPITAGLSSINGRKLRSVLLAVLVLSSLGRLGLYLSIGRFQPVKDYISDYPMISMTENTFDPIEYFLNPYKRGFNLVEQYTQQLNDKIPRNAAVYDNIYDYPFTYYYQDIKKQRLDIHCPIVFAFWVTEGEIRALTAEINGYLQNKEREVFLSVFVFRTLEEHLEYRKKDEAIIFDRQFLYHLSN